MSVASEIARLQQAKADIKQAIEDNGVTVPSSAKLDTYDNYIAQISSGGQGARELLYTYRTETTTTDPQTNENTTAVTYTDASMTIPDAHNEYLRSGLFTSIVNNDQIVSIKIPSDITKLSYGALGTDYSSLVTVTDLSKITYCGERAFLRSALSGIIYMPQLQTLNDEAFAYTNIISVDNLGSVTKIPEYCFQHCGELICAILPKTITAIEMYAFDKCINLQTINIDELTNLTTIGQNAFDGNGGGRITFESNGKKLPASITSIGSDAFKEHQYMNLIIDLPLLTSLGDNAFYKTGITAVNNLGSVTSFSDGTSVKGMFNACTKLTNVTLPSAFTSIGSYSFYGCTALTSINFPSRLTKIGAMAFQNTKLTTIDLSTTEGNELLIYNDCFRGVTTPMTIKLPKDVTFSGGFQFAEQGGNTYNATTAETLSFDLDISLSTATTINACTFYRSRLTKITSLGSITTIAAASSSRGVFEGSTYLTEATLPSTLTSLGTRAFYGCTHLTTLTVLTTTPPTFGSNALYNTTALVNIYVPAESVATYQAASGWSAFAAKISAIPTS